MTDCRLLFCCHLGLLYKFVSFIFQVKSGTIFDNILVTDSVEYAETFAKETFEKTKEGEKKMKDEQDEKERKEREEEEKKAKEEEDKKKAEEEDEEEEEEDEEVGPGSISLFKVLLIPLWRNLKLQLYFYG